MRRRKLFLGLLVMVFTLITAAAPASVQALTMTPSPNLTVTPSSTITAHPFLTITPGSFAIKVGETGSFKAIWHVHGQPDKDVTNLCQWYADDIGIAAAYTKGAFKGTAPGTTKVHAYYAQGSTDLISAKYAAADLTVGTKQLAGSESDSDSSMSSSGRMLGGHITVAPKAVVGKTGDTHQFKAYLSDASENNYTDVTGECQWTIDDSSIASLTIDGAVTVKGLKDGTTLVRAYYAKYDSTSTASVTVDNYANKAATPDSLPPISTTPKITDNSVYELSPSGIARQPYLTVTPDLQYAKVGETVSYKAIWHETGHPDKDVTNSCIWYPKDNKIAEVNPDGTAKAKASGVTQVCALYEQGNTSNALKYASGALSVYPSKYLTVSPITPQTAKVGQTLTYKAVWHVEGSPDKDVTDDSIWYLGDYKTAEIYNGEVKAKAAGFTEVCAYYDQGDTDNFAKYSQADLTVEKAIITTPAGSNTSIVLPTAGGLSLPTPKSGPAIIQFNIGSSDYAFNGKQYSMDALPVITGGRTLLPIRCVASSLGATLDWKANEQKITMTLNGKTIELWIGQCVAKVNGVDTAIDSDNPEVAPVVIPPGRTMLPLRFIAEQLGCQVAWDQELQMVIVTHHNP